MKKSSKRKAPKSKSAIKPTPSKSRAKKATASSRNGTPIDNAPIPMVSFQTVSQQTRPIGNLKSGQPLIGEPLPSFALKLKARGFGTRGVSAKDVFFPDERQAVADPLAEPYRWICYLRSQNDAGEQLDRGTAFLIAPNLALTAAHCVYLPNGVNAQTVNLWPAHSGGVPDDAQAIKVSNINVPQAWLDSNRKDATADFAVLVLEQSVPNGFFATAHYKDADFQNMLLNIAGYPFDRADNAMHEHSGPSTRAETSLIFHRIDTKKGQSGAPIFVFDNGEYNAVAIHTGRLGDNHGVRLNNEVLDLIDWFATQHRT